MQNILITQSYSLPLTVQGTYIVNLVLVHKERNEGDKLQQECLLYRLHGNIDLIQQKKTPLTIDQIGILTSGTIAHKILIEGAPGIGKTTFLWQLCHQWAVGKLLQQWELVILVHTVKSSVPK